MYIVSLIATFYFLYVSEHCTTYTASVVLPSYVASYTCFHARIDHVCQIDVILYGLQLLTVKMARVRIRFELAKDNGCRPRNVTLRLLAFMVITRLSTSSRFY